MPAYNEMSYDKLLLDGLRLVSYRPGNGPLTNEGLVKAVTMNENLKTLGYTLNPQDLMRIAQSPSADTLYNDVKKLMSDVKAKPMYPDFPTQVMEMDEAQFRMHQAVHYFSTYGLEFLTGIEVEKGWLPAEEGLVSDTEKTEEDTALLSAKVVELVPEDEKYTKPFTSILSKRERMTNEEREIIKRCAESGKVSFNEKISVPFKENLRDVFMTIAEAGADGTIPRQDASQMLYNICQHPGDVTENLHRYLVKKHYSLRTAEKKMFVSLYDKFSNRAFKENLTVSNSREKFTKEIFRRINFTGYTKSREKAEAVRRIGREKTWEAKARDMITSHDPDAVRFAAQRPGMLIRMTSMALRNGYSEKEITEELSKKSGSVSAQTLVSQICMAREEHGEGRASGAVTTEKALEKEIASAKKAAQETKRSFKKRTFAQDRAEILEEKLEKAREKENKRIKERDSTRDAVDRIFTNVLRDRLSKVETGLAGRTIYLDTQYDISRVNIDPSKKLMNHGYFPSHAPMKIPDGAKRVRCFVYWNDRKCVDLDLHAYAVDDRGDRFHIGWNESFYEAGIVMSGDITHSDAAEYIDIELDRENDVKVDLYLNSFRKHPFAEIDTCYVGIMAVDKLGENVKLYDPKNCFESKDIVNNSIKIKIGTVDTKERILSFDAEDIDKTNPGPGFSLKDYLELLAEAQGCSFTEDPDKADVILTLTKPASEKEISLVDNNYFFEAVPGENIKEVEKTQQKNEGKERKDEPKEKEEITPVYDTKFTRAFIAENAAKAAEKLFAGDNGRAVVVMDADTGKTYVADRENPGGAFAEGKSFADAVMDNEEKAVLKDYKRVFELLYMREELTASIWEAKEKLGIELPEKDHRSPSME